MRPLHPCPMCGHEVAEECRSVENELPFQERTRCIHCRDDCIPIVQVRRVPPASPSVFAPIHLP